MPARQRLPLALKTIPDSYFPAVLVACAIAGGIVLGYANPELAIRCKPLGDAFILAIRILVGPTIFFTVVSGIAGMRNLGKLGRVGIKAVIYFEVVSTLALLAGLLAAHLLQPGAGFNLDPAAFGAVGQSADPGHEAAGAYLITLPGKLLHALAHSLILQVLLAALLCGAVLALLGTRARRAAELSDRATRLLFRVVHLVSRVGPLAAFGAIAFTVGQYGLVSMQPLLKLIGALYLSMGCFILVVLGLVAWLAGFNLLRFIAYIKEELLLVIGVGSSVVVLPSLIEKLQRLGCSKSVVGLVLPAGYSFNLNGSSIYLTLGLIFLAQAFHVELSPADQLGVLAVAMVTSKGASGVAGSAFIALTATLAVVPAIPVAGMVAILGIERLLKCRPLTNIIGNGVACIAIAAWNRELDRARLQSLLAKPAPAAPD